MNIKQVAIARTFVGNKLTEMALTIDAHKLLLKNMINATTMVWNCVIWFKDTEQTHEIINHVAGICREINLFIL